MDRMWESGIIAGIAGFGIMVLNLVIVGTANIGIEGQPLLPFVLLLAMDVLAFIAAGLFAGLLASRYDAGGEKSFLSGVIAGCFVVYIPASILVLFAAKDAYALLTGYPMSWSDVPLGLIILFTLVVQVAMTGLIAWACARHFGNGKTRDVAAAATGEDSELIELQATYDDLWKDARTLASDLNNSVQMYLMVGVFALIFGFVLATYALASWQRVNAGSTDLADAAAAIGETIGCAMLLVTGPLLIRWYFKLKARYARLMRIEQETGE